MNVKEIDDARAQAQLEAAKAELEKVEAGESTADRWQLEQRIRHAENQLAVRSHDRLSQARTRRVVSRPCAARRDCERWRERYR